MQSPRPLQLTHQPSIHRIPSIRDALHQEQHRQDKCAEARKQWAEQQKNKRQRLQNASARMRQLRAQSAPSQPVDITRLPGTQRTMHMLLVVHGVHVHVQPCCMCSFMAMCMLR